METTENMERFDWKQKRKNTNLNYMKKDVQKINGVEIGEVNRSLGRKHGQSKSNEKMRDRRLIRNAEHDGQMD